MRFLCYDTALNGEYTLIQLLHRYPRHASLFRGTDDEGIWDAAPYLFEAASGFYSLRQESALIRLDHCMLLETEEPLEEVIRFLQGFVYQATDAGPAYFRIWDPRVLLEAFPEWKEKDRIMFFEFFDCFYTECAEEAFQDRWKPDERYRLTAERVRKAAIFPEDGAAAVEVESVPDKKPDEPAGIPKEEPKRRRFFIE
ncbi:DUF4123 domain-containing protein [Niabella aurantiaca]|uniref:DUF4123 domain-containing protein n=1 Tax=Niabella aurantiaca TaxID=379900 RepID=UPI000372940D|nr:DUF4123 domain-containing protein [Niabella aurantiaca]